MGISGKDTGKKLYTPPRLAILYPDAVQAKKLAQALASGSDDRCLKLIRQMQSHSKLRAGAEMGTLGHLGKEMAGLLARVIRGRQGEARAEKLERLALEIVEYGRMNATDPGDILIEVPEASFRLRESPHDVRESLCLLQMKGIAKRTSCKDYWKLRR